VSTEPKQGRAGIDDIATVQLPSMERIRAFVVVAEELHFGRAAARLHLTQPPLSRQIMLLEQEVGVPLLDRSGRAVTVTPAGRVFLAEARRILRLAEESTLAVRRIPTGTGGTLAVGFTAVSVHGYVRSFLRRAAAELPHVDLVLRELVTADQVEAIASGDIDLGFVRPPVNRAGLDSRVVQSERLLLAAPDDSPFAERGGPAAVAELDGCPLVMYSPVESRYFYELLLGMTVRAQARPRYTQYVSQVSRVARPRAGRRGPGRRPRVSDRDAPGRRRLRRSRRWPVASRRTGGGLARRHRQPRPHPGAGAAARGVTTGSRGYGVPWLRGMSG
jgi:DNA-binding transcriptional LysR family regulator